MPEFKIISKLTPQGDQPAAIQRLTENINSGQKYNVLLGVTGSGKTFTMANVIERLQKPTLVISHNKTLAAQLYEEFKELFPENAVEYFVSYYDYYQPEAYIPQRDIYIEKDAARSDDLDRHRLSATTSLSHRRDVIIVASVSSIFGLGNPEAYKSVVLGIRVEIPLGGTNCCTSWCICSTTATTWILSAELFGFAVIRLTSIRPTRCLGIRSNFSAIRSTHCG